MCFGKLIANIDAHGRLDYFIFDAGVQTQHPIFVFANNVRSQKLKKNKLTSRKAKAVRKVSYIFIYF